MLSIQGLSFKGLVNQPVKQKDSKDQSLLSDANLQNASNVTVPAYAWQANRLSFGSLKVSSEEFKVKMQDKIDRIRNGTYVRTKEDKEQLQIKKRDAVKNLTGPLSIQCADIAPEDFKELTKLFEKIQSNKDLQKLLDDPRIPADKPIVITDSVSANYDNFMNEVEKGNATNDVQKATAIVESAIKNIEGDQVIMPEIAIKVSRKALAQQLIDHINAGYDYDSMSIIGSPYFSFTKGDELAIEMPKPVYDR